MLEKNNEILKIAIQNLPCFRMIRSEMWCNIEQGIIKSSESAIVQLPTFIAPEHLWETIEDKMDVNQKSQFKLQSYSAPDEMWSKIEKELDLEYTRSSRFLIRFLKYAASIVLILSIVYGLKFVPNSRYKWIAHNVKEIIWEQGNGVTDKTGIESILTPALCANNPQICVKSLFIELNNQLDDIKAELLKMQDAMESINDPAIMKYYYRLENQQAEIEKRLLKIILET